MIRFQSLRHIFLIALLAVAIPARGESGGASADFQTAESYRMSGDHRNALVYYRKSIEVNPGFTAALLGAARSAWELGDFNQAHNYYERVLSIDPDRTGAKTGLGLTYLKKGDLIRSGEILKEVAEKEPGNESNNHALALYHIQSGRPDLANLYLKKVIRSRPTHLPSLLTLAEISYTSGKERDALMYLARAEKIEPDHPDLHRVRGEMAMYHALHSRDPREREEAFASARNSLLISLDLKKDQPDVEHKMVLLDFHQGRMEEARSRIDRWMDKNGESPGLLYLRELIQESRGERSGSEHPSLAGELASTLRLSPLDSMARFKLENMVLDRESDFSTGGAYRTNLARFHREKSEYFDRNGKREDSIYHIARLLKLQPGDMKAHERRLEYYRRNGDYESFLKELTWISKSRSRDARIQFRLETAMKERNGRLPYRENLLSPEVDQDHATFRRTPSRVFVFDFESESLFPYHPDGGRWIARAIEIGLDFPGSVRPVMDGTRKDFVQAIHSRRGEVKGGERTGPFSPDLLPVFASGKESGLVALVYGSYVSGPDGILVDVRVVDSTTGNEISRFRTSGRGNDGIYKMSRFVAWKIRSLLPVRGRVVRVRAGDIFLNLGKVDGLDGKEPLEIRTGNGQVLKLKSVDVSSFITRARLEGGSWLDVSEGDPVMVLKEGEGGTGPAEPEPSN